MDADAWKIFDVGPGELKVTMQHGTVLRAPVLGSCVALFMYDVDGKVAGLAHVMFPSSIRSSSVKHADFAVRELARRLTEMGSARVRLAAALVCRDRNLDLSRKIIDSIKAVLVKEKIGLQAELFAQSKISASAEMDFDTYAIRCSSRYGPPLMFIAKNRYFNEVLRKAERGTGFDVHGYKTSTLVRRMGLRMARVGAKSYREYSKFLDENPEEFNELLRTLAINVTGFFRDRKVFEHLGKNVLPALALKKRKLRAWCAGCATGEEAYSLAVLFEELQKKGRISGYSILATDLNTMALRQAVGGRYDAGRLKEMPAHARKLLDTAKGKLLMPERLKRHIRFRRHDLTSAVFPKGFDLVLCRNVVIFYKREAQRKIMEKLERSLAPGGYLVLGTSETTMERALKKVGKDSIKAHIYRREP